MQALGVHLLHGLDMERDVEEGVAYLEKAAALGDAEAQLTLAHAYNSGEEVGRCVEKAYEYYRQAAAAGNEEAVVGWAGLALLEVSDSELDREEAVRSLEEIASGDSYCAADAAAFLVGYYGGGSRLEDYRDFFQAKRWLKLATELGFPGLRREYHKIVWLSSPVLRRAGWGIQSCGWMFLCVHFWLNPPHFALAPFSAYIAIVLGIGGVAGLLRLWCSEKSEVDLENEEFSGRAKELSAKPVRLFASIPAQDGFFFVPLVYLGITPVSATVAGLAFGLFHYPANPLWSCLVKAAFLSLIAYFVLPFGVLTTIAGHLVIDAVVFLGLTPSAQANSGACGGSGRSPGR